MKKRLLFYVVSMIVMFPLFVYGAGRDGKKKPAENIFSKGKFEAGLVNRFVSRRVFTKTKEVNVYENFGSSHTREESNVIGEIEEREMSQILALRFSFNPYIASFSHPYFLSFYSEIGGVYKISEYYPMSNGNGFYSAIGSEITLYQVNSRAVRLDVQYHQSQFFRAGEYLIVGKSLAYTPSEIIKHESYGTKIFLVVEELPFYAGLSWSQYQAKYKSDITTKTYYSSGDMSEDKRKIILNSSEKDNISIFLGANHFLNENLVLKTEISIGGEIGIKTGLNYIF